MHLIRFFRMFRLLWKSGILCFNIRLFWQIGCAWRNCRGTFAFLAHVAAQRFPDRIAIVDDDGEMTFGELNVSTERLASRLRADYRIGPNGKIAIAAGNHRTFIIALLASTRTGADTLILNPTSPTPVMSGVLTPRPDLILFDDCPHAPHAAPGTPTLVISTTDIHNSLFDKPPAISRAGKLDVLTAGSTGISKRVGRRPGMTLLLPFVLRFFEVLPIVLHRPTVLATPLFHGHGLTALAMALACASPLIIGRRMDVSALLAKVPSKTMPPVVSAVPTVLQRWLRTSTPETEIAAIISGSAPLHASLCRDLLAKHGPILFNLYGSTESGIISLATPSDLLLSPGTVGKPLNGNELRIVDETGSEISKGQIGRIHVRGPMVATKHASLWHDTGDLGRLDSHGFLQLCGRSDSMFISGGENVYPHSVQSCLLENQLICEAAVAVVADAEFGFRMNAWVVLHREASITVGELKQWLRERLERHQIPATIEILPSLPLNAVGKLDMATCQNPTPIPNCIEGVQIR